MRRWAAVVTVLAAMSAVLPPAAAAAAAAPTAPTAPAGPAGPPAATQVRPLLLIAIPDLRWTDLESMPVLRAFSAYVAVGVMSVRSEGESTRCGDGVLELSAGTRVPSGVRGCVLDPTRLAGVRSSYRHARYGARVGALGDGVGVPAVAVGAAAVTLLTDSQGHAVPVARSIATAFAGAPTAFVAVVDGALYGARDRHVAAAVVDRVIAAQFRQTPRYADVVIAGISDGPTGGPHLHPLFVASPGFAHRELTSPTTGRAPYVQLFDLTATLLALRGQPVPPSAVSGREVRGTDRVVPAASSYVDLDRHARRALTVGHPTFAVLCGVLIAVMLLVAAGRREAAWLARLLVLAPVAPTLLQLVPWWRWSLVGYVAGIVVIAVAGAVGVTLLAPRNRRLALAAGPALVAGVLLADQLAGAPLQLSAPFGDNPLVAGRFRGMGNIDFGLTMAALLLVAAAAATAQRSRPRALGIAAALGLLGVVVDGAPSLGNDIGGLLALLPAVALLLVGVGGVAVTAGRVAAVALAGVAVAVAVAAVDYARPAASQTHAGRFVGQVLHGGAWQVVHRKADAVVGSLANPVVTAAVVVAVALAARWRPRWRRADMALLAPPLAVLALLGTVLNDSGVFVAGAVALASAPALLALGPDGPARDTQRL